MRGTIKSSLPKSSRGAANRKDTKPAPPTSPEAGARAGGVYESVHPSMAPDNHEIRALLADIITRLNRIEEKIDENVYPPESAIKPEFIRQVKKAEGDIRKGKGKTYESMNAFIRAVSE